jgi:hypothetical protein
MIYTIGYQRLTSRRLEKIVGELDAILLDCRYRPFSQRPEFCGDRLAEQFGSRYQQRGHELGGHGHTTAAGIDRLRLDAEHGTLILLCTEEAPADCHRHHAICGPHFSRGNPHLPRRAIHRGGAAGRDQCRRRNAPVWRAGRPVPVRRLPDRGGLYDTQRGRATAAGSSNVGGRTSSASSTVNLGMLFWTSRGICGARCQLRRQHGIRPLAAVLPQNHLAGQD